MRGDGTSAPAGNLGDMVGRTAVRVVAAYLSHNALPWTSLRPLLVSVHEALFAVAGAAEAAPPGRDPVDPIRVRESIRDDGLISFIDGRSYKTLKRHLTAHGLTPERYRATYGLPVDYPMVAPGYAAKRSQIARAIQLSHRAG